MLLEQVRYLREFDCFGTVKQAMNESADTIEDLSAKLVAANMERAERYHGNVIEKDKLLEDLIPILNEHGDMFLAGIIIGLIDS